MRETGFTQGQGTASHVHWRGRWERQALLKAKEKLATVIGGVDGRGRVYLRPRNGYPRSLEGVDERGRL